MSQEGDFSFLVHKDAERSLLGVKVLMKMALRVLDVVVLEAMVSSLIDCLLLELLVDVKA